MANESPASCGNSPRGRLETLPLQGEGGRFVLADDVRSRYSSGFSSNVRWQRNNILSADDDDSQRLSDRSFGCDGPGFGHDISVGVPGRIVSQLLTPTYRAQDAPPARRWSTVEDYSNFVKKRNWIEEERNFLALEALRQRQNDRKFALSESDESRNWPFSSLKLGRKQADIHPRLTRTWGQFKSTLCVTVSPAIMGNFLYSKTAGRIVGTCVAIVFALLGYWLQSESGRAITIDIPYTPRDSSVEFVLHTPLQAPVYVYTSISGFWQNAREFLSSQPPILGRGYKCHNFVTAGQFCAARPLLHPPLFARNQTFCDIPPETLVFPCGMNAAWINLDTYQLWRLKGEGKESELTGGEERVSVLSRTLRRNSEQILERGPRVGRPLDDEGIGSEATVSTTSLLVGLETLRDLLGWNENLAKEAKEEIPPFLHKGWTKRNQYGGDNVAAMDMKGWKKNIRAQQRERDMQVAQDIISELLYRWTPERLAELAQEIKHQHTDNEEVQLLIHLLKALRRIEERQKKQDLVVGPGGIVVPHVKREEAAWREVLKPLYQALSISSGAEHLDALSAPNWYPKVEEKKSTIQQHHESVEMPDAVNENELRQPIAIRQDAEVLLTRYQRMVSFPHEAALASSDNAVSNGTVRWIDAHDVRWFHWRRPAPTSTFCKLFGRIETDLESGRYRLYFIENSFPELPNVKTEVRFLSFLPSFGSPQYLAAALSFFVAILYTTFWLI